MEPKVFAERLLVWFDAHGRKGLPWQENPTPYRVWVSEVMLQQTQVSTVIPYYGRFMARFPSVEVLAAGPIDEVLHLWTGLGYYARARNLHACALVIVECHGGTFPRKLEEVTALPGIGRSTAGAILALSRGERHPILDGNAKRVLARVFGIGGDPSSAAVLNELWARADACTPEDRAAAYTQAIMDLGATLCTRTRPACTVCPMSEGCVAALEGRQAALPGVRQRRERGTREAVLLLAESGKDAGLAVLVERRPSSGIWGGLWSPPEFESESEALEWCRRELGELESSEALAPIDHAFTHFDLRLNPLRVRVCRAGTATATARVAVARTETGTGAGGSWGVREGDDRLWYALEAPPKVGLPQPIHELFARMRTGARA
ncbi:MAG TPA: A/G-specific adenine glycosylase [Steroidobacteraceae bacterium]|nr:A/G-specific adenine glycosylase [Steroidobacteraceae bacterium]